MSRIGKLPIDIPAGVEIKIDDQQITVKGKLGELKQQLNEAVNVKVEANQVIVERQSDAIDHRAKHGLYRALIQNMVKGVSEGFEIVQEFVGVGYKAEAKGQVLEMALGYSHNVVFEIPAEVKIETITERGKNPLLKM
ncbi:MAG TPA: 50S ribosomal protein L6, partial [Bacteroidales bacterium]|nr:50S ribosomal protein L6 [Bacteroidales bacterium]